MPKTIEEKPYQSWSLIILAYNEEHTIERVCQQAVDFLSSLPDNKKEILIIDDGSTDGTLKKIKALTSGVSFIKAYWNQQNSGIGAVLARGYSIAQMENICAVPGDGQFDLNELRTFRDVPVNTVISFYRTSYTGYSFFRKLLTWTNRWLNKILFGFSLQDVNYIKIYKRDSLKELVGTLSDSSSRALDSTLKQPRFVSKSSFLESEIIYYLTNKNHTIIQTSAGYLPRRHGTSAAIRSKILKMVFKDILKLLKIRFISRH